MICSTSKTIEVSMAAVPGTAGAMLRNGPMLGWMDVLVKDGSCVVKDCGIICGDRRPSRSGIDGGRRSIC